MFWSQEFVDEWNDEHSPKKLILPPVQGSPSKPLPDKGLRGKRVVGRGGKKAFEDSRSSLAESFLRELDDTITGGKLGELTRTTGGIKITWTNKLNTTAGRAHWKREAVCPKQLEGVDSVVRYKHHASIELAGKVIDDEHRLLNVLAHEFCHLANFMVSGVTENPHGKEFKAWAAKCSQCFGDRGIEVTTRHSYDIAFKYVWECTACRLEFKRHSKSIDPKRHRCGSCESLLKQTKPVPRGPSKPSEYHVFMREHMKVVRQENPGSPQKDVMRRVAERWADRRRIGKPTVEGSKSTAEEDDAGDIVARLEGLALAE